MPRGVAVLKAVRRILLTSALFLGVGLWAEAGIGQETPGGWRFTSLPHADLWFHGMALVDPIGPGPNPLYDPAYAGETRRAKEKAGVGQTRLDARLGYFREAFQRDPALEVLHFVPLYFPQAGRTEVFTALRLLSRTDEGIPRAPSARTAFGLAAIGSVLTTPSQRGVLGEFVSVLDEEWSEFFESWWQQSADHRGKLQSSLQSTWHAGYGEALAPVLAGIGMTGGVVIPIPAIGIEGRIFGGSPQHPGDNVLVISAPPAPEHSREAVFSMLRELSFPLVRRVLGSSGDGGGSRNEAEGLAARAAIRSGALMLEIFRPEDLEAYQRFFLSKAGGSAPEGAATGAAFEAAYPLNAGLEEVLREEIISTREDGGVG